MRDAAGKPQQQVARTGLWLFSGERNVLWKYTKLLPFQYYFESSKGKACYTSSFANILEVALYIENKVSGGAGR